MVPGIRPVSKAGRGSRGPGAATIFPGSWTARGARRRVAHRRGPGRSPASSLPQQDRTGLGYQPLPVRSQAAATPGAACVTRRVAVARLINKLRVPRRACRVGRGLSRSYSPIHPAQAGPIGAENARIDAGVASSRSAGRAGGRDERRSSGPVRRRC